MACLFAVFAGFAPRLAMLFLLLFTDIFSKAFDGWLIPLLGIAFLPYTTLFYTFAAASLGEVTTWGWFSVFLGLLTDIMHWYTVYRNRTNAAQWSAV